MARRVILSTVGAALLVMVAGCSGGLGGAPSRTVLANGHSPTAFTKADGYLGPWDLYVVDYGNGKVLLYKNKGYIPDGQITIGLNGPQDAALDKTGNLYVANATGANVTEYGPGDASPSYTYSSGMVQPISVTVDAHGHVYEADVGPNYGENYGLVNEYAAGTNTVLNSCKIGISLRGVAVDSRGDVFVSYIDKPKDAIAVYRGGLHGCKAQVLRAHVSGPGGIVLDRNETVIVTERATGSVDIIKPPYDHIGRRVRDFYDPLHVAINRENTKLFVTDAGRNVVSVVDYASAKRLQELSGFDYGFGVAFGAVDARDAVY